MLLQAVLDDNPSGSVIAAIDLLKCVDEASRAQAAEHIVTILETLENDANDSSRAYYLTDQRSTLRDGNDPVLRYIWLTARGLNQVCAAGYDYISVIYRDFIFDLQKSRETANTQIAAYSTQKESAYCERRLEHTKSQELAKILMTPRENISPGKSTSTHIASTYPHSYDSYDCVVTCNKRPRAACQDAGIALKKNKPLIHQGTEINAACYKLFQAKVRRRITLALNRGVQKTWHQAAHEVASEDKQRGTYIQQDLDGNDYGTRDQTLAMFSDSSQALKVHENQLALPAPA